MLLRQLVEGADILEDRTVHVDAPSLSADVDPPKVERIVENLLSNAVKHTPPGTPVWASVKAAEDGVLISVEDAGAGIPEELREVVFEPFRQGRETIAHAPGMGVGLALVARFAELHGGRAWVEERVGGGAAFRVFLHGTERRPSGPLPDSNGVLTEPLRPAAVPAEGRAAARAAAAEPD